MAQSTGLLFSSQTSWASNWWRQTGDIRASSFLFQLISVVMQRFNSVLLHDGFIDNDRPEYGARQNTFFSIFL